MVPRLIRSYEFVHLQWCETQRECNRLRLVDILVRPMQRLTKYSLLLKAVLKNTEDLNQRRDLLEMVMILLFIVGNLKTNAFIRFNFSVKLILQSTKWKRWLLYFSTQPLILYVISQVFFGKFLRHVVCNWNKIVVSDDKSTIFKILLYRDP